MIYDVKELTSCRICNSKFYKKKLKLNDTPIANELYPNKEGSLLADKIPLVVVMCKMCKHIQLKHIVSKKRLFDNYVYSSSTSSFFQDHFKNLSNILKNNYLEKGVIIEVGSNDGYFLNELTKNNFTAVGIEPSKELYNLSKKYNVNVINDYLGEQSVNKVLKKYGQADIVVGNNVFAHIEKLPESFLLVNKMLKNSGLFIIEVANFNKILEDGIFDTIYHEHMSYHTIFGFIQLSRQCGFAIKNVFDIPSHGGSFRFILEKTDSFYISQNVIEKINNEGVDIKSFKKIEKTINKKKKDLQKIIKNKYKDYKIIGYGAPAKLVTFMYQMFADSFNIEYVVDDNEMKQNKYIPGLGYKIISYDNLHNIIKKYEKVVFIIFPWNLSEEIIEKIKKIECDKISIIKAFPVVESLDIK